MPNLGLLLASGEEEEELPITDREAEILRNGFNSGEPFSFVGDKTDTDDTTAWVWIDPAKFAMVTIEED